MAGHLDEGFGAAGADRFGEQVTFRIRTPEEFGEGFGDDQAGFGVEMAIEAPHPTQRFGQVQLLRRAFACRRIRGFFRRCGGDEFFGDDP